MNRQTYTAILFCTLFLAGCRSFTSPARIHRIEPEKSYWTDYDATRRGAIIFTDESGRTVMLAEPAPDVAIGLAQEYLAKVNYKEISAEASLALAENVVQLGKRTSTIMFLRESLYRLAELASADQLDPNTVSLYKEAMRAALELAKAESKAAEAQAIDAKTRADEARMKRLKDMGFKGDELRDFDL